MVDTSGKISSCASADCGWKCCQFQQGNYIVLYPGELKAAQRAGQPTAHLQITDADYHGGQKAVCTAKDTGSCDGGLKPLDCKSYPFFPATGDNDMVVKGLKCPLSLHGLTAHEANVRDAWNGVMASAPEVREWLDKVELVGYSEPLRPFQITTPIPDLPKVA